eukprot:PITA_05794
MLEVGIIEPVEESEWVSPMMVQEKKQKGEIRICVDLQKINDACVHDPFLTSFTNEVLDSVGGKEAYSSLMGFSGYQIMLNMKKCILCVPFGILLGHVVCNQGLMVDPAKIALIVNLEAPRNVKQLCMMLGHTRYYINFIKSYAQTIVPMEKLLKKDTKFCWDEECQHDLDVLK